MSGCDAGSLEALLAHARALVGVELGELADALGLPVPVGRVRTKGWSGPGHRARAGRRRRRHARPRLRRAGHRAEDRARPSDRWSRWSRPPSARSTPSPSPANRGTPATSAPSWPACCSWRWPCPTGARSVGERQVAAVRLWSPDAAEEAALRADFELFVRDYYRRGRAAEITGHLGAVLQVRPKGRDADDTARRLRRRGAPHPRRQARLLPAPRLRGRLLVASAATPC